MPPGIPGRARAPKSRRQPGSLKTAILHAEEAERRRIANEIHDVALQELFAIQFGVDLIKRDFAGDHDVEGICRSLQVSVTTIQSNLRTLSYVLHPPELERAGLSFALRTFAQGFARRTGLSIDYADTLTGERLDAEIEIALYRVAREALFNISRHAHATEVEVALVRTPRHLRITVRDNGIGIPAALTLSAPGEGGGVGLSSMRERIAGLGGSFAIRRLEQGTLVEAKVPLATGFLLAE